MGRFINTISLLVLVAARGNGNEALPVQSFVPLPTVA
jgi:hypothetical protein